MKIVLYLFGVLILISCTNHAGFKTQLASESLVEQMVFCNPIRTAEGFNGVIAVNTNENNWIHQTKSTILQFEDVPDSFKTIPHSYIQLFPFNYKGNRLSRGRQALEIDIYNLDEHTLVKTVEYISYDSIKAEGYSVDEFFFDHIFVIRDTAGWQGMVLGLFNSIDKPLIPLSKILTPPFDVNPHIFNSRHISNNSKLASLHPFHHFIKTTEEDEDLLFLSKARDACFGLSGISFDFYGPNR